MDIANLLTRIAGKIRQVFNAGKTEGYSEGKQAEWNEFWDSLQDNGNRIIYDYAFYGTGWNDVTFKPKYDLKQGGNKVSMFQNSRITDLEAILERQGVKLLCGGINLNQMFQGSTVTVIPEINLKKASIYNTFNNCKNLTTIRKIQIDESTNTATTAFNGCIALQNIIFEGVIGTSLNMKDSPLSKASIISVINALSQTASGMTLTLKKSAVNEAFGVDIDDETTYPEGSEFYTLRHSKDNWTFSYV